MIDFDLRMEAYFSPYRNCYEVFAVSKTAVFAAVASEPPKFGEPAEPLLRITAEQAQILVDSLWNAGLRPVGGSGTAGQAEAMKQHIEDLRYVMKQTLK